jgi:hypothetical protein
MSFSAMQPCEYRAFVDEPIEIVGVSPAGSAPAGGQNPGLNYPGPHR